jgi:hypothetical protein
MRSYYEHWASRFGARYVVVYANALFYLNVPDNSPSPAKQYNPPQTVPEHTGAPQIPLESRLLFRLRDILDVPQWIVDKRDARRIAAVRSSHQAGWVFQKPPEKQLAFFLDDMTGLVDSIEQKGSVPVLVTHARRTLTIDDESDRADVAGGIVHTPRATPEVIIGFAAAANDRLRALAAGRQLLLVDAEAPFAENPDDFSDFVHFSERGAAKMAKLIAQAILASAPSDSKTYQRSGAVNAIQ